MAQATPKQPRSLTSKAPSWPVRLFRNIATRIDPELFEQPQGGITMSRYGVTKSAGGKFGDIDTGGNQFAIERPGGAGSIDPDRLLQNNRGFVYASVNAKAREVMIIDWRLFEKDGDDHIEKTDDDLLDLLDTPNENMDGMELKYLTSALQDLTGSAYWYLQGVSGALDKPKAIYLMPGGKVRPVIDRRSWPYQLTGYRLKLETYETVFKPYEVIHFRWPNPGNFFEGYSPTEAGAEYIDNDNHAQEFNRLFFRNGARPAGFLETELVAETQVEALKIGFMDTHGGIENMNRIGVLPKGVKWAPTGTSPKDMDFKNLSEDSKSRILMMYGTSPTILGTAESATNRATAETADYVFSKRVVKPWMMKMCSTINSYLVPRYGDNRYVSFIDPVPEDKEFRTKEMQAMSGDQPVMTPNEVRDAFAGLGPVEGGDKLYVSTSFQPIESEGDGDGGKPERETDPALQPEGDPNAKRVRKAVGIDAAKAANGLRIAFRPARTKLQKLAKQRVSMQEHLTKSITEALAKKLANPTTKWAATKQEDEARWKEFSEYTQAAEKEITETVRKINDEQKKEVLANLPAAIQKGIDPSKLFNIDNWISITTNAVTPVLETLFEHQSRSAAAEIGKPELNPFNDTTRAAVKASVQRMSESYNQTTLEVLETKINDGLTAGAPLSDITKTVEQVYEWSNDSRAAMVAKTESFRTANDALKTAWKQSGVVKTVKWYTASGNPCAFCQAMEGKTIGIDENFFENGASLTVGEGDDAKTMSLDYGDVSAPPLHPLCMCFLRPEDVSI